MLLIVRIQVRAIAHLQKNHITIKKIIISLAKLATVDIEMKNNVGKHSAISCQPSALIRKFI